MSKGWTHGKQIAVAGALLALVLVALGTGPGRVLHRSVPAPEAASLAPAATADTAVAARHAMSAVSAARQLLLEHDPAQAEKYLDRADRTLTALVTRLATQTEAHDRVTLYSAFGLPAAEAQRAAAQLQLQRLADPIRQGEHDRVTQVLRRSGLPFVYHYLDLPLADTARDVHAALSALRQHETDQATSILEGLEQGLQDTVVAVNGAVASDPQTPSTAGASPGTAQGTVSRRAGDQGAHS